MAPPSGESVDGGRGDDVYEVMGVPFSATEEEIRRQYHKIVRTLHPDRRKSVGSGGSSLDRFHQVQNSWRILSDPCRRMLYDLRNYGKSSVEFAGLGGSAEAEQKLIQLQKEQAARDVENMSYTLKDIMKREAAAKGIIVKQALYGDLRLKEDRLEACSLPSHPIELDDLRGPVIQVAEALQSCCEQHSIVLPGGIRTSKADLPGFYHPAPLNQMLDLHLYVLYEFRGTLHEVIVGDKDPLQIPMRKHAILPGGDPRGPFTSSNIGLLHELREARRRKESAGRHSGGGGSSSISRVTVSEREAMQASVKAHLLCRLAPHPRRGKSLGEVRKVELLLALSLGGSGIVYLALRWARENGVKEAILQFVEDSPWCQQLLPYAESAAATASSKAVEAAALIQSAYVSGSSILANSLQSWRKSLT
mmetsp:Transcript_47616/g.101929  ORF Transcript_47616/g.101929 Transcript_47616/m.101929 type:complete len:420 (-) Transcript_47616:244-1503(-)|eukprot:CAMPEP_0206486872 /NCGR_PEP_ID=MMETSP0324_2-20121206/41283_1 /ASSEMBLY_ACC=CAM_ASM_000836 /TAXON_ID=2866 /ORGANISM="Crypthecodinium cohnii, Strain Seligo" /LENGTH=419 /DNA_ID=CAMNT_0053965203 /DNA_START=235 /DNA_END=1494 /DNA_ORIENTATION=-